MTRRSVLATRRLNVVLLVWKLALAEGPAGELILVPEQVQCVCKDDVHLDAPGSFELGCRYGLEYWEAQCANAERLHGGRVLRAVARGLFARVSEGIRNGRRSRGRDGHAE